PDPPALLLMGAYRRDEAENSPFLRHILGEGGLTDSGAEVIEVAVDPLGNEEASQLTAELLRDQPTANALFSASIAREAEGVPFFIAELVQHLKARSDRGHHHTPVGMDSISLDEVIAERVRGMPRDAQRLLEVLSVAAGPIEQGIALEAAGLPPGERASMLSLRAARLIRTRGTRQTDTAETYHDRVRETVVAGMPADAVRVAHAGIAQAIESWDVGDPERLVEHYTGAGDGIRAGETAIQAAHAAGDKLAFNRAAELYRRAIELLPPGASESRELHERLGQALANAGRGAQAAEALIRAAEGAPPAEMRRLQRLAAQQYLRSGRMQQGGELAKRLLSDVGIRSPKSPAGLLAAIVWNRGLVAAQGSRPKPRRRPSHETRQHERVETLAALFREFGATEPLTGALLQAHYLRSSIASGDPAHLLQAFAWQAFMNAWDANERGAHHCLDIVGRLAREVDTPYAEATAAMARAGANLFLGKFTSVREPAARAEAIFREQCTGASWERVVTTTFRFGAIEQTGGFQDVLLDTPHLEREGRERDDRFTFGFLALSAPLAHLLRDDPEAALRLLEEQRSALGETFDNFHMWVMNRTVDSLIYAGRAHEACDYLDEHWERFS
ncbi:MAG: hypothetical protein OXT09_15395, partial [Myxococcales bacterium]|nr:hypothetical protein [Myxococcales bacterium]